MAIVASGSITVVDITDARQLVSYIGSSLSKTVIYDPNSNTYIPNYGSENQVLTPQLFVAGTSANLVGQADSVRWFYKIDGGGERIEITESDNTYTIESDKSLTIKSNVLQNPLAMVYICEIVYNDPETNLEILNVAEIELIKVSNGVKGEDGEDGRTPVKGVDYFDGQDGQDGKSAYLWIRYSQNSDGNPMTTNPANAIYVGTATTDTPSPPQSHESYNWVLIKGSDGIDGEKGADGRTSYLHIKYSNDGGQTFTGNNGEDAGEWIGTYVDFEQADSDDVNDYTWNKVVGEDGKDAVVATVWTPNGNMIKNHEGTLIATITVYSGATEVVPSAFKWYIQDPSATTSNGGDSDGGNGWRRLTSSYNDGVTGYNTSTITIPADAIMSMESFKCVATYNGNKYQDVCTVTDVSDPVVVSIVGVNTFKNGQGTTQLTAKVYRDGVEIDVSGQNYVYSWSIYNSDGVRTGFNKAGKTITVSANDIDVRGNIICEVSEHMPIM